MSVGGIDAHVGAVGSGVKPGTLVRILGTSACDMAVAPPGDGLPVIPGISGVVRDSILSGSVGLEAGQAAVGDLYAWWTRLSGAEHEQLTERAARLRPGQSGLLALDWNNGNRSILQDPRLTGLLVGQTLATQPHEVYGALIEATAFGAHDLGTDGSGRRENAISDQLRRHCREDPARAPYLRERHEANDARQSLRTDLRARRGDLWRCRRAGVRILRSRP
ncbi:MAG: hypothetical protein C4341_09540 [Armatimonadota bacterium]